MTVHDRISFDRRAFLKASGILAVGFSMAGISGPADATTLRAPKSVAKEAIEFVAHHQPRQSGDYFLRQGRSRHWRQNRTCAIGRRRARRIV